MTPPAPGSTAPPSAAVDEILRRVVAHRRSLGPLPWARYFTPKYVTGAFSELHDALNAWHRREVTSAPGAMDAFAAPRGHGKSTAGVELAALFHVANCTRRFVVIASDTWTQATDRLATIITEVEENPKLRAAYPDLRPAVDSKGQLVRWRDDDVVFACGCRIMAVGAGKSVRGARIGDQRPDLLLLDDLEDEGSVATDTALEKRLRWILRVALGLADARKGLSVLWVGTILSRAALLNQATAAALEQGQERPEWARAWTPHVFAAERRDTARRPTIVVANETDETSGQLRHVIVRGSDGQPLTYPIGEPMWAGELTRGDLALIRYRLGAASYAAEYLSDPVDEALSMLAPPRVADYVNPTDPIEARVVRLPGNRLVPVSNMIRAAALDPQYANETATNDPDLAAIVVAGAYGGDTFLLDVWIGRDRHGQAARLVDMAVEWGCYVAGVEAVAAQSVTADAAAYDGRVPIIPIPRPAAAGSKEQRALPLSVRLGDRERPETCRVWALPGARRETEHGTLLEHLSRFPNGRYKDPVDATVDAVNLAHRAAPAGGGGEAPRSR